MKLKRQRNDKEGVTTRDLRNDTMQKEEIDSNNSKNAGYSTLLLVKCLQVAEWFEHWSSVKSCPNR